MCCGGLSDAAQLSGSVHGVQRVVRSKTQSSEDLPFVQAEGECMKSPSEGELVLMQVDLEEDGKGMVVHNFIVGTIEKAYIRPSTEKGGPDAHEIFCKDILWSDYKGWKAKVKKNKVPFDMRLAWVCDDGKLWVVDDMLRAEAVMMGLKL